jgi:large subunit ribosomal protein L10
MSKAVKQLELDDLRKALAGVRDYVLLEPVKVDSATESKKVFGELGVNAPALSGPTLLCWGGESPKALAKAVKGAVTDSKKDPKAPDKYKERTGLVDGAPMPLASMENVPTRLEAIGEVVSALCSAGSDIAGALVGPATQLAGILKAIEEKTPEGAPAA